MAWKSRIEKEPPPIFWAQVARYISLAHQVKASREVMEQLRPFFAEEWRNGKNAKAAVETTCACDGKTITPSPAVAVQLIKGEVRPPKGAKRGEVFGEEEVRESVAIARLRERLAAAQRTVRGIDERAQAVEARLNRARSPEARGNAAGRHVALLTEKRDALVEVERLEASLAQALADQEKERSKVARSVRSAPQAAPTPPQAAAKRPEPSTPSAPKGRAASKPEPAPKPVSKKAGAPFASSPSKAITSAILKAIKPEGVA